MIGYLLFLLGSATLSLNLVRVKGVSIPDAMFIAALLLIAFEEGLVKKKPIQEWFPSHPVFIPAFLILIGGLISTTHAFSTTTSISITLKEFYIFSIFTSLVIYIVRRFNVEAIVTALTAAALLTSLAALNDYALGYKFSNELLMKLGSMPLNESWNRYSGLLGHPNEQSMFLAVVFPLAFTRFLKSFHSGLLATGGHFLVLVILGAALLLTGSVSGYISVLASSLIIFLFFLTCETKNAVFMKNLISRAMIGGVIAVAAMALVFNTSKGHKFLQSDFFTQSSVSDYFLMSFDRVATITAVSRFDDYILGLKYVMDDPLIGAGMDQSGTGGLDSNQMVTALAIHNTILQSWVAGGLLTFIGTIAIYYFVINKSILALIQAGKARAFSIIVGLSASCLGFFLIDMTSSNIYQRVKWLVFALLLGVLTLNNSTNKFAAFSHEGQDQL